MVGVLPVTSLDVHLQLLSHNRLQEKLVRGVLGSTVSSEHQGGRGG